MRMGSRRRNRRTKEEVEEAQSVWHERIYFIEIMIFEFRSMN